jgi:methionyl-tRNA synthetase
MESNDTQKLPVTACGEPNNLQQQPSQPAIVPPASDEIDIETFAKIKFRVATIEKVEPVPKSKKLYQIQLDVGELGKRQIVSGIALHYTPEQLVGRQIVIVANLKPAKLMGVESRGMLLAASTQGDEVLALLSPDKPIQAGARVR